ncbi:hypothetical protein EF294_00565 [Gordonia oryzae]|uniref:Uncharacterized protein n=1 Tax=Gordonia oryzae TaxID=2487349 RepID=A0A3N4GSY5_9ACTN|nr:hypothetical protein EF294_00565 [Gordonia oryzae]
MVMTAAAITFAIDDLHATVAAWNTQGDRVIDPPATNPGVNWQSRHARRRRPRRLLVQNDDRSPAARSPPV